jgi:parvulin-like peptidyl-prolyl isomerase
MAEEIRGKLAEGADFAGMAQMYSEDSTAEAGGDWGWIDRKTLNEELNRVAFSLQPGQLSRVVQLGDSLYIMRVEARKAAVTKPLAELREEISKKLFEEERIRLQEQWVKTLREKAYVKVY